MVHGLSSSDEDDTGTDKNANVNNSPKSRNRKKKGKSKSDSTTDNVNAKTTATNTGKTSASAKPTSASDNCADGVIDAINECKNLLAVSGNLKTTIKTGLLEQFEKIIELVSNNRQQIKNEIKNAAAKIAAELVKSKESKTSKNDSREKHTTQFENLKQKEPKTYAQATQKPVHLAKAIFKTSPPEPVQTINPKKRNNDNTIFLKTKKPGDNAYESLQRIVNPYQDGISFAKPTPSGGVIVACNNPDNLKKLQEKVAAELQPIEKKAKRKPQIVIHKLPNWATTDDVDKAILNATGCVAILCNY